jgi:hypothetical protein
MHVVIDLTVQQKGVNLTCKKKEHDLYLHTSTQITVHPLDLLGLILAQALVQADSNILTPCKI